MNFGAEPDSAVTLDAGWYHDDEIYKREQAAIFGREWLLVGRAAELPMPGDYIAGEVAGRPVFVIRDRDGGLRGFHNVCRHRAGPLLWDGRGHCDLLRCRYHGWIYDLDGRLRKRPDFADDDDAAKTGLSLFAIHVASWRGLVFVNLAEAPVPLEAGLGGLVESMRDQPLESFRFHGSKTYDLDVNWKTYTDNYLEGYHIPYLHPGLAAELDMQRYRVSNGDRVSIHRAAARAGAAYQGLFLWRWPNNTVGVYDGGLNICRILPRGPRRTRLVFDFLFAEGVGLGDEDKQRLSAATCKVVEEDFAMCAAVQRNLEAGLYRSGPLSPRHENGVAYFHTLVRGALAAP